MADDEQVLAVNDALEKFAVVDQPKAEFVATGAWFFFVINLTKVPVYAYHGMVNQGSLSFDVVLLPMLVVGAWLGRWMVHRVPQRLFEIAVFVLTAAAGLVLFAPLVTS